MHCKLTKRHMGVFSGIVVALALTMFAFAAPALSEATSAPAPSNEDLNITTDITATALHAQITARTTRVVFKNTVTITTDQTGPDDAPFSPTDSTSYVSSIAADSNVQVKFVGVNGAAPKLDYFFYNCTNLTGITGLSVWDTSNVTSCKSMFENCSALTSLSDIGSWSVTNVTNVDSMFKNCTKLNTSGMSSVFTWQLSGLTSLNNVFEGCTSLNAIPQLSWDVSNVTSANGVLKDCTGITSLTNFPTSSSSITSLQSAFQGCTGLTSISAMSQWTYPALTNITAMFKGCTALTSVTGLASFVPSGVTSLQELFSGCSNLSDVTGLENLDTSNVTNMASMFAGCVKLQDLTGLVNWDVSKVSNMSSMFNMNPSVTQQNVGVGNWGPTSLEGITHWKTNSLQNMSYMFAFCCNLSSLAPISTHNDDTTTPEKCWNVSNVTTMSHTFFNCSGLTKVDSLSTWDVSKVNTFDYMFCMSNAAAAPSTYGEPKLTSIKGLATWNTSSVTNLSYMFDSNTALEELKGVEYFDVSKVTNFAQMFSECKKLTNIDGLASWQLNTTGPVSLNAMFNFCEKLTNVDGLSSWDVSGVKGRECMAQMFQGCKELTSIDGLSSWNIANAVSQSSYNGVLQMFADCAKLSSITLNPFVLQGGTGVTNTMSLPTQNADGSATMWLPADSEDMSSALTTNELYTVAKAPFEKGTRWQRVEAADPYIVVNNNNVDYDWSTVSIKYTGFNEQILPNYVKVGDQTLTFGTDYIVRYQNEDSGDITTYVNEKGTYTATIEFQGNYVWEEENPISEEVYVVDDTPAPTVMVNFYAGDGTFVNAKSNVIRLRQEVGSQLVISETVENPVRENYTFTGWADASGVVPADTFVVPSSSVSFYAQWSENPSPVPPTPTPDPEPEPEPEPGTPDGWSWDEDGWRYVEAGEYVAGWFWIDDSYGAHWYYFNEDTRYMAESEWLWADGSWYWVCSSGPMICGLWQWIGGEWYGFWWNGKMCTGWVWDNEEVAWFYCYNNGVMARNTWVDGYWLADNGACLL